MIKKIIFLLIICISFLINTPDVLADTKGALDICDPVSDICITGYYCQTSKSDPTTHLCQKPLGALEICVDTDSRCIDGYTCQTSKTDPNTNLCQKSSVNAAFGKIKPPDALRSLLKTDPTGASGISRFLSNFIALIYSIAAIVLIFMMLWGAFEWMTSGGDKEKVESARRRIISAVIGILLFAAAFAIIAVLGTFTGFKFFEGQNSGQATTTTTTPKGRMGGVQE